MYHKYREKCISSVTRKIRVMFKDKIQSNTEAFGPQEEFSLAPERQARHSVRIPHRVIELDTVHYSKSTSFTYIYEHNHLQRFGYVRADSGTSELSMQKCWADEAGAAIRRRWNEVQSVNDGTRKPCSRRNGVWPSGPQLRFLISFRKSQL